MAEEEVGLAAYTNRLSGRPGDTIRFHVSSSSPSRSSSDNKITAKLTRCICADPNPQGPGCIEENASEWFDTREFVGRHQKFHSGSYAKSRDGICVPSDTTYHGALSVEIWMFPTHIVVPKKEGYIEDDTAAIQCVWSWGELGLHLMSNGRLALYYKGENRIISSIEPAHLDNKSPRLLPNKWYHCTVNVRNGDAAGANNNNCHCELVVMQQDEISKKESQLLSLEVCLNNLPGPLIPSDDHFELSTGGTFNGRLENPKIKTKPSL